MADALGDMRRKDEAVGSHHDRVFDRRNHPHLADAPRASEGIGLIDLADQPRPGPFARLATSLKTSVTPLEIVAGAASPSRPSL
jgi:hypothetical protein